MDGIHNALIVSVCASPQDAIKQGYFYRPPIYKPIQIVKVVVVENGTTLGNPTVDFILEDESGQKYVCMLTGRALKSIPCGE